MRLATAIIEEIRSEATGAIILKDWLGDGGEPVPHRHAEARALVCLGCAENKEKKWWEKAKEAVALAIRWHIAYKNRMNLHLPVEDELGMCRICKCCLQLKPWAPIKHIKEHMPKRQTDRLPAHCWIKKEMEEA